MRELLDMINLGFDKIEPIKNAWIHFAVSYPIVATITWVIVMTILVKLHLNLNKNKKKRTLWDANAVNEPHMVVLRWIIIVPIVGVFKLVTIAGLIVIRIYKSLSMKTQH